MIGVLDGNKDDYKMKRRCGATPYRDIGNQ